MSVPARKPRRRRGWIIAGIVAGAVLLVGSISAGIVIALQNSTYSPTAAVTDYIEDIEAGRFADAWQASGASTTSETALVEAAQVELTSAISEVTLGEPIADGDTRRIPVAYLLDGNRGEGEIVVRSVGTRLFFLDVWQIVSGLETQAQIDSSGMTRVVVGGTTVPVGETGATVAAYPGVYPVTGPESEWVAVTAEPLTVGATGGEASVALRASDALRGEVESQVKAQLDECAASTSAEPEGCPFRILVWSDVAAVTWRILAYPSIELTGYESFTGKGGEVRATYREAGVGAGASTQSFAVDGTIAIEDDEVTVALEGY